MIDQDGADPLDQKPEITNGAGNPRRLSERYRLDDLISDSSFAQVWRGFDLQQQRIVAVKRMKSGKPTLANECGLSVVDVSRINHPGIVRIHDVIHEEDTVFVVSDFVEGGNLSDYVGRQIVSTSRIVRWITDVAETLEYCHARGVIHGDIKPTNILLDLQGRALLGDFGGRQISTNTFDFGPSANSMKYLSPEQLAGERLDARSDFYSLAVVLHELLSGELPYSSSDPNILRHAIRSGVTLNLPNTPRGLRNVCVKALQRDRNDRYSTAAQLVDDLRRCSVNSPIRRVVIVVLALFVFVLGFNISQWWPDNRLIFDPTDIAADWMKQVATLSAREQVAAVASRLMELNPGFNGEVKESIENDTVVGLEFLTDDITDLSPVASLQGLKTLICEGSNSTAPSGRLTSLAPLKDLKLTRLSFDSNVGIDDLSPLRDMPLTYLNCSRTNVVQLRPIEHLPLQVLVCNFTRLADLSPLAGMPLREFYCDHTQVADLLALHGMPLEVLSCQQTVVADLAPLQLAVLHRLECGHTEVANLAPLKDMNDLIALNVTATRVSDVSPLQQLPNLKLLWCDVEHLHDVDILRSFKSLQFINNTAVAAFWAERSAQQPDAAQRQ